MVVYVTVCQRCGHQTEHDGPVWPLWYLPLTCDQPEPPRANDDARTCGGVIVGPYRIER